MAEGLLRAAKRPGGEESEETHNLMEGATSLPCWGYETPHSRLELRSLYAETFALCHEREDTVSMMN